VFDLAILFAMLRSLLVMALMSWSQCFGATAGGVMLGTPTGLNLNSFITSSSSVDFGWNYHLGSKFRIHSTYLSHNADSLKMMGQVLDWYYGLGGSLNNREEEKKDILALGARGSLGILWDLKDKPFELFAEVAAVAFLIPATYSTVDLLVGGRYQF
jgi:hypothetical protein